MNTCLAPQSNIEVLLPMICGGFFCLLCQQSKAMVLKTDSLAEIEDFFSVQIGMALYQVASNTIKMQCLRLAVLLEAGDDRNANDKHKS